MSKEEFSTTDVVALFKSITTINRLKELRNNMFLPAIAREGELSEKEAKALLEQAIEEELLVLSSEQRIQLGAKASDE